MNGIIEFEGKLFRVCTGCKREAPPLTKAIKKRLGKYRYAVGREQCKMDLFKGVDTKDLPSISAKPTKVNKETEEQHRDAGART